MGIGIKEIAIIIALIMAIYLFKRFFPEEKHGRRRKRVQDSRNEELD